MYTIYIHAKNITWLRKGNNFMYIMCIHAKTYHVAQESQILALGSEEWCAETVRVDSAGELCQKCLFQTLLQGDLGCISFLQPHFRQCPVSFSRQFSCFRFYCFFLNLSSCPLSIASTRMDGKRIASSCDHSVSL